MRVAKLTCAVFLRLSFGTVCTDAHFAGWRMASSLAMRHKRFRPWRGVCCHWNDVSHYESDKSYHFTYATDI